MPDEPSRALTPLDELRVVEAQYRVLDAPMSDEGGAIVVKPHEVMSLWTPVPIPEDWQTWDESTRALVPYRPKLEVLSRKTPKHERKRHPFHGFAYTTADYARLTLNDAFGNGRWTWVETNYVRGRAYLLAVGRAQAVKKYIECIVEGYIMAPGILPAYGIGTAPLALEDTGDPRFMEATAKKSASSMALKDAAKRLGVGADIKEDEQVNAVLVGTQQTIKKFFDDLCATDKKAAAIKAVKKHAPAALTGEVLESESIDETVADALLQAMTELVIA